MIMKTEDTNEATTLDETQNNKEQVKADDTVRKGKGVWQEVAIGSGTGILFGAASTILTGATPVKDDHQRLSQVDEYISVATCVDDDMTFSQAFATARAEVGPGGVFEWHGNLYGTYTAEEWGGMSAEEREEYNDHFIWASEGHSAIDSTANTDITASKAISMATCVDDNMSFSQAFAAARAEVGTGGVFEWNGNLYNTFTATEWNHMSAAERAEFGSELASSQFTIGHSRHDSASHVHTTGQQDIQSDSQVNVLSYETFTAEDGSLMDIALVEVDGQQAVLIDTDRDGTADFMAMDLNQNEGLDEGEMFNISNENITMQQFQQEANNIHQANQQQEPQNESQLNVLSYETVINDDGSQMDVAVVDIEGQQAVVVDYNRDGKADLLAMDLNHNNQLDEGEIADISNENIAMQQFQQQTEMNTDNYLAMNDEGPDYIDGPEAGNLA